MKVIAKTFIQQNFANDEFSKETLLFSIPKLRDVILSSAISEAIEWVGLVEIETGDKESTPVIAIIGGKGSDNFRLGVDGLFTLYKKTYTRTDALSAMVLDKQNTNPGELYNVVFL